MKPRQPVRSRAARRRRCQIRLVAKAVTRKMRRRPHEHRPARHPPNVYEPVLLRARPRPRVPRLRAEQALGPFYACLECFGPLEVGYEFPAVTRAQIERGPKNIWRYRALLPVRDDIASIRNTEPGFTRL